MLERKVLKMKGWYRERYRHALAAKGIKTNLQAKSSFFRMSEQIFSEQPEGQIRMSSEWSPARGQGWPTATHPFPIGASPPESSNAIEKMIYDYWNANVPGSEQEFNYQEAFDKLAPIIKKKVAEHGQMTKSDYIEAQMDYIARRRHNLEHPESPVPMAVVGGDIPEYRNWDTSERPQRYDERMELLKKAQEFPSAYVGTSVLPGKPGIWADDFRTVRWKYLRPVGIRGVANILAEGTMSGKVNTERKEIVDIAGNLPIESSRRLSHMDLEHQYEKELRNRPLQEDELNYLWDTLYKENRWAHRRFGEFSDLKQLYEDVEGAKKSGYDDKLKNLMLFDKLVHAQHVTGELLPIDINEMRNRWNRIRASNVKIAKRIDSYAGKKPNELLYGRYDQAIAAGKKPIIPKSELKKGIKVEMEHTPKRWLAEKIAKDHLSEGDPLYYTHLKEMEEKYMEAGGCK